jgi:hypothetical protein
MTHLHRAVSCATSTGGIGPRRCDDRSDYQPDLRFGCGLTVGDGERALRDLRLLCGRYRGETQKDHREWREVNHGDHLESYDHAGA